MDIIPAPGGSGDVSSAVILAPATSSRNIIQGTTASVVPLTVKGAASQTADLFKVTDSADAALLSVGPGGGITYDPGSLLQLSPGGFGLETARLSLRDPVGLAYNWGTAGTETPLPFSSAADYHYGEFIAIGWTDAAIADKDYLTGRVLQVGIDADAAGYWYGDEVNLFAQNNGAVAASAAAQVTGRSTVLQLLNGTASIAQGDFVAAYVRDPAVADQLWGANYNAVWFSTVDVPTSIKGFIANAQMHGTGATAPLVLGAEIAAENHHAIVDLMAGVRAGLGWTASGTSASGSEAWFVDTTANLDNDVTLDVFGGVRIVAAPWVAAGGIAATNAYGLFIEDPAANGATITNKWAVWAETGTWFVGNTTAPGSDPTGGGYLYASSGALYWRGSSGTITKVANA